MATALRCCLSSCLGPKFTNLSISDSSSSSTQYSTLSFSRNLSRDFFSKGCLSMSTFQRPLTHSIVCEVAPTKKADSALKRARQSEKRRLRNKARKSEVKTRMRKVLEELEVLKKKQDAKAEEILPIEKLIGEAFSAIDKAVQVGSLHRNTGANRKSRLSRRKKAVEMHHGWYTPAPATTAA